MLVNGFSLWNQEICLVSLKCPGKEEGWLQVSTWSLISTECRVSGKYICWSHMKLVEGQQKVFMRRCGGYTVDVLVIYEVFSGDTILWRAVLGRFRVGALAVRSLFVSDGCVSAWGVPASPTSSRKNLNLDRKSCHTTYQPGGYKRGKCYLK